MKDFRKSLRQAVELGVQRFSCQDKELTLKDCAFIREEFPHIEWYYSYKEGVGKVECVIKK